MNALEFADMIERYNAGVMSQKICEDYKDAADELRRLAAVEAELVALKKSLAAAQAEAEPRLFLTEEGDDARCAECGAKLETIRPGKHQHPTCSQAQPLTDEVLLRQALEALIRTTGSKDFGEGGLAREGALKLLFPTIATLRERLGEGAKP